MSLAIAARGSQTQVSVVAGSRNTVSAGEGLRGDIVGNWTTESFNVEDGTLLVLSTTKMNARVGNLNTPCRVVLRVRSKAPYNRVRVALLAFGRASRTEACIEGRFDVLTLAEAEALGFQPAFAQRGLYDPAFVNRAIIVTELEPGIGTTKIENREVMVDGEIRNVQVAKKRRALDL